MNEEELFDPMIEYLRNEGYEILEQHHGSEHGIDIVASRAGTKLNVQLKAGGQPYVDFGTALYQIMKDMKDDSSEYAIGISKEYVNYARRCEYPIKKLRIKIFLITESGVDLLF